MSQKQNTRSPRDSSKNFKNKKGILEILSHYFNKEYKGFSRFFQIIAKTRQGIHEILSNYFKNKMQEVPATLLNYFKNQTQRDPEIPTSNNMKNKIGILEIVPLESFKLHAP
mgnify:CR=1 FL=1